MHLSIRYRQSFKLEMMSCYEITESPPSLILYSFQSIVRLLNAQMMVDSLLSKESVMGGSLKDTRMTSNVTTDRMIQLWKGA